MSKKIESPTVATDLNKVKLLVERGKLEKIISELDVKDIEGTIKKVPKEVLRLMIHLFYFVKNVDEKVKALEPSQRIPLESLLETARKHQGEEFSKKLIQLMAKDGKIELEMAVKIPKIIDPIMGKIDHVVNDTIITPQVFLSNHRVFVETVFMQNDEILFRTNAELDDFLRLINNLMIGATRTFALLQKNMNSIKPNIRISDCQLLVKAMNENAKHINNTLNEIIGYSGPQRKKVKSVSVKRVK